MVSLASGSLLEMKIACSGRGWRESLAQSTSEFFDEQFNVNVRGAFFTVRHAVPLISDSGAILFNASMVTSIAEPMASVYSAKAAVRSFGRSLAAELAPKIRVNTVSPGPIKTSIFGKIVLPADAIQSIAADIIQRNPSSRTSITLAAFGVLLGIFSPGSTMMRESRLFENSQLSQ